jgi:hypothetical protein
VDPRRERIVRNEVLLRRVNEAIEEVSEDLEQRSWTPEGGSVQFHCECGREGCAEHIAMDPDEFERVHVQRDRFVVVPGHATAGIESVVEETDRYVVVDKLPAAEDVLGDRGRRDLD